MTRLRNAHPVRSVPTVEHSRCLRARIPRSGHASDTPLCSRCQEACLGAAITCSDEVQIDGTRCEGCGMCASACPSSAITDANQDIAVLTAVAGLRTITIGCGYRGDPAHLWSLVTGTVCGLSWQFLAACALVAVEARVRLNTNGCAGCSHGTGAARVERTAAQAGEFLRSIGYGCDIRPMSGDAPAQRAPDGEPSGAPGMSRRDFFRSIIGGEPSRALEIFRRVAGCDRPHSVRSFLWDAARRRPAGDWPGGPENGVAPAPSPWGAFEVTDACDGCGLCERCCPWHAWNLADERGSRRVFFEMRGCRNCGLCPAVCPNRAIVRSPTGVPCPVGSLEQKAIVSGRSCRRCGTGYAYEAGELCANCAKQRSLLDVAGS